MNPSILPTLKRLLTDENDHVVVCECRRCGTTVDSTSIHCSNCGRDSIARYEIR